ncbi:hypothetical protein IWX90DRAFT_17437 [Phyllosticta citrichinensis]|uniref:Uncharacterized protein n=1 Tax=Phyllosticta citrichinensis TaxID=1130410 RepID=A0ABR1Y639_9PEZI
MTCIAHFRRPLNKGNEHSRRHACNSLAIRRCTALIQNKNISSTQYLLLRKKKRGKAHNSIASPTNKGKNVESNYKRRSRGPRRNVGQSVHPRAAMWRDAAPVNIAGEDDAAPGVEADGLKVPPGVVGVLEVGAVESIEEESVTARLPGPPGKLKSEEVLDVAGVSTTTVVVSPRLVGESVVVVVSLPGVAIVVVQMDPSAGVLMMREIVPPSVKGKMVEVLGVGPQYP